MNEHSTTEAAVEESASAVTEEIPGLLAIARQQGERDVYVGKRGWIRYTLGMRTEVTTDPTIPFASWPVTTHNVSGGGMGFWSKRPLEIGAPIHILDVTEKSAPVWIPATVMHCTVGIRGYLLGAQFDLPAPLDDPSMLEVGGSVSGTDLEDEDEENYTTASLGSRIASLMQVGGVLSAAVAMACVWALPGGSGLACGVAGAVGASWLVGRLGGKRIVSSNVAFLSGLRRALSSLAQGRTLPHELAEPGIRELCGVRATFLELLGRANRREEGERIQRQKLEEVNQMKSNLIAIVSHDLRTPLTSILLYARMLNEDLDSLPDEDKRSFLKIIADECTRLSRLVDDLLEVQRLESDRVQWNLQEQDLSEVIRATASLFEAMAQSKSIDLVVKCPNELPSMVADADKMSQVLSNLVSNAIKYTQAGGQVEVCAIAHGKQILLRISDNGPGIPRDMWDSIFDRFSQIRDPDVSDIAGVGLGLYIVKKLIEGHGGAVWVDSEPGQGSKFYVSLPIRTDTDSVPHSVVLDDDAYRVLVCDSDPQLVAVIGQNLRQNGYDVRSAHSGKRLLTHLAHGDIDVVITDVLLPDMGADELLNGTQSMGHLSFKLIVHSYAEDGKELSHPNIDRFVQRPVMQDQLVKIVRQTMAGVPPVAAQRNPKRAAAIAAKSAAATSAQERNSMSTPPEAQP